MPVSLEIHEEKNQTSVEPSKPKRKPIAKVQGRVVSFLFYVDRLQGLTTGILCNVKQHDSDDLATVDVKSNVLMSSPCLVFYEKVQWNRSPYSFKANYRITT